MVVQVAYGANKWRPLKLHFALILFQLLDSVSKGLFVCFVWTSVSVHQRILFYTMLVAEYM